MRTGLAILAVVATTAIGTHVALGSTHWEPSGTDVAMVADPTAVVESEVLPSTIVAIDPPKRYSITVRAPDGDVDEVRIAKRCPGWETMPIGTVVPMRWTTYRDDRGEWREVSDDGFVADRCRI